MPISGTQASHASDYPRNGALVLPDNILSAAGGTAGRAANSAASAASIRTTVTPITLHGYGLVTSHVTTQATVADALLDAGVTLNKEDAVLPAANTLLTPGIHVYVGYTRRINVRTRNDETELFTLVQTVGTR